MQELLPVVVAVEVVTPVPQVALVVLEEVVVDLTFLEIMHRQKMEIIAPEAVVEVDQELPVVLVILAQEMVVPVS
jgi:hypothetical protein|tara:strand:- start:1027 stop:1251 length:225 start_codon:yes stop_codon:yes gene_type:complete